MKYRNREKNKKWIVIYAIIAVVLFVVYYLLNLEVLDAYDKYIPFLKKFTLSLILISIIFMISKIVGRIVNNQNHLEGDRYNLLRIIRFISIVLSLIVVTSFLFQNLLAAAATLGLFSLILGFALQAPITSFIAWVYLIFRRSYLVGDRIQIKGFRGDVLEISYLDTSILECSGDYLGNDRKSGRTIRFPNSLILKEEITNYSGPDVPFIWNETPLQIAFTSDLQFVEDCLLTVCLDDFKERYPQLDAQKKNEWEPAVYFRINSYAWMEAVISYPVEPLDTTGRRNRILKNALPKLNGAPDKVQFPEGSFR
ncbi:mechanosensitive ion channel family protein [Mesonia ostreae]|uniref:Mechanosensitive ion channel n=1 Tax=Mesonia ostreae TaxID=861110 RepID=A0ABU2KJZ1_9FLAO|nr:mechanosensitive ion channel domain-containing protein [Mesonia ostreae]MDT0295027.1 mechanosensitive ion channel [Mesonia ostreae]